MSSDNKNYVIDLRSDTVTAPTQEMRRAMCEAIVGDDVFGEDPTVVELETRMASLLGKEAGLFVCSGTMGNLLAIMVHCYRRGSEAIVGDLSHTFLYEQGGAAYIAGVQLATVQNKSDGTFCLQELRRKIRYNDIHEPFTSLVVVENTHNMCGGKVIPLEWLDELAALVKDPKVATTGRIALHMDGARVFNAAAALKVPLPRIARDFDSVNICLSKGLSAPIGSVLVGSKEFIKEAHRLRKALGGGMRQVGIIAAAGIVALDTIAPYLHLDHERTKRIANALHQLKSPNFDIDSKNVHTNILLINIINPKIDTTGLTNRLMEVRPEELKQCVTDDGTANGKGIVLKITTRDWKYARLVLYHQNTDKDVDLAIKKLAFVMKEYDSLYPI